MITISQYLSDVQTYLDSFSSEIKSTLHVSLPAIVTKFNAQKQTINEIVHQFFGKMHFSGGKMHCQYNF